VPTAQGAFSAVFGHYELLHYENSLHLEPPLECPLTTFGGLSDREASRDELEACRDQTSAAFSVEMFPGDHFFVHSAQPLLLQALSREFLHYCQG